MKIRAPKGLNAVTLAAAIVFAASSVLAAAVSWYFIAAAALACVLPDLLRLVKAVRDIDECQDEAAGKSARIAYAAGILLSAGFFLATKTRSIAPEAAPDALLAIFTVTASVRFISYSMFFWDPRIAARCILSVFGVFWFAFVLFSGWNDGPAVLLPMAAIVVPFAAGALAVRRFPLVSGIGTVLLACAGFVFFQVYRIFAGNLGSLSVFVLLVLPLLASGISLIAWSMRRRKEHEEQE